LEPGGFSPVGMRCYAYGYRSAEVLPQPTIVPCASYALSRVSFRERKRQPVRISLGPHFKNAACPVPDYKHSLSQCEGTVKRIGAVMPVIDPVYLDEFRSFVKTYLPIFFPDLPFSPDHSFDWESYIVNTNYDLKRRENLTKTYNKPYNENGKALNCKGFTKDEPYEIEYKPFRGIMSRSDDYKTRVGPFFQDFDKRVFATKHFIKKIPVSERPKWLTEKFMMMFEVFCTDYSSFEATFCKELLEVEFEIYDYALQSHSMRKYYHDLFMEGIAGMNHIVYEDFVVTVEARRMSGEMNTSSGNGIMNFFMSLFTLYKRGNSMDMPKVFEGDDGVNAVDNCFPTVDDYARLGANIKIEIPENPTEASFCGQICDPVSQQLVTDPIFCLMTLGWTTKQYLKASPIKLQTLLRCKSLSMLYEYPACPIVRSLALYGIRVTQHITDDKLLDTINRMQLTSSWYKDQYLKMMSEKHTIVYNQEPSQRTRHLVFRKYNITFETQKKIENYFDNKNDFEPIDLPILYPHIPKTYFDYYSQYCIFIKNVDTFSYVNFPKRPYYLWKDCNTPFIVDKVTPY